MKRLLPLLILATACSAHADSGRKPYAVYGPTESCLYTFVDNEAFVTCDESAAHIASLYDREKQRILQLEFDEREERKSKEWRERRREERKRELDAEYERTVQEEIDRRLAEYPRGWRCVARRLPAGATILDSTSADERACEKEFSADYHATQKGKKRSKS